MRWSVFYSSYLFYSEYTKGIHPGLRTTECSKIMMTGLDSKRKYYSTSSINSRWRRCLSKLLSILFYCFILRGWADWGEARNIKSSQLFTHDVWRSGSKNNSNSIMQQNERVSLIMSYWITCMNNVFEPDYSLSTHQWNGRRLLCNQSSRSRLEAN